MTLPAGVTVRGIVQKVRPGAYEKATVDEWFEGNGFGRIVDGQEELSPPTRVLRRGKLDWTPAWFSALRSLVETEPEAVVKAVWPEAWADEGGIGRTDKEGWIHSLGKTWLSAARKIVKDMKGEGR